jgi:HK97 family phage portal protein
MLGRLFRNTVSDLPWIKRYDADIDTGAPTWSGAHVTTASAQQLLVVYGASAFHSDHLSTMPIDQYVRQPDGTRRPLRTDAWLEEPEPGTDITTTLAQLWWSYWLGGHALAVVIRDQRGRPAGLIPLHPDHWQYRQIGTQWRIFVNGRPAGGEFLSVPHTVMPGCPRGINPIEAARQTIGMGLAAAEYGARFFAQGTTMSGVIQMPGPAPAVDELKLMRESWVKTYGGSGRAHLPGLLFGGATWQQISVTPEQAQFLETRRFTDAQICSQLFHLPPSTLAIPIEGGATVQYQNIESAWAEVVRRWRPHLTKMERALSALLPRPQYVRFNRDVYLEATTKERFDTYAVAIGSGVLTPNEAREREDMPPLDGGDQRPMGREVVQAMVRSELAERGGADHQPVVVNLPDVHMDAPIFNVEAVVPAPVVNVMVDPTPTEVYVAAPNVTVEGPTVPVVIDVSEIELPPVQVVLPPPSGTRKRIIHDAAGRIVEVVEEPV